MYSRRFSIALSLASFAAMIACSGSQGADVPSASSAGALAGDGGITTDSGGGGGPIVDGGYTPLPMGTCLELRPPEARDGSPSCVSRADQSMSCIYCVLRADGSEDCSHPSVCVWVGSGVTCALCPPGPDGQGNCTAEDVLTASCYECEDGGTQCAVTHPSGQGGCGTP